MFCVNVMYDVVRLGYCAVILLAFSIIGVISGYGFTLIFGEVEKSKRMKSKFMGLE